MLAALNWVFIMANIPLAVLTFLTAARSVWAPKSSVAAALASFSATMWGVSSAGMLAFDIVWHRGTTFLAALNFGVAFSLAVAHRVVAARRRDTDGRPEDRERRFAAALGDDFDVLSIGGMS